MKLEQMRLLHLRNEERISTGWYSLQTAPNWFELLEIKRDALMLP
jgi:hypothetical protein